jgi:hypothetical protein
LWYMRHTPVWHCMYSFTQRVRLRFMCVSELVCVVTTTYSPPPLWGRIGDVFTLVALAKNGNTFASYSSGKSVEIRIWRCLWYSCQLFFFYIVPFKWIHDALTLLSLNDYQPIFLSHSTAFCSLNSSHRHSPAPTVIMYSTRIHCPHLISNNTCTMGHQLRNRLLIPCSDTLLR